MTTRDDIPEAKLDEALEVLIGLLHFPPSSAEELEEILSELDPAATRHAGFELFLQSIEAGVRVGATATMLHSLGTQGREDDLVALLRSPDLPSSSRRYVARLVATADPKWLDRSIQELSEDERDYIMDAQLTGALFEATLSPDGDEFLPALLGRAGSPEESLGVLEMIERIRARLGFPAAHLYAPFFQGRQVASLLPHIQDSVAEEGASLGVDLLEKVRDEAKDPTERSRLDELVQRARARSLQAGPLSERSDVQAFVSSCDGQAAFTLLLVVGEGPDRYGAALCIRAHQGIHDGYLINDLDGDELGELLETIEERAHCGFAEVPPPVASAIVTAATDRHPLDPDELEHVAPEERRALQAAMLLLEAARAPEASAPELPTPAKRVRPSVDELLGDLEYATWFLMPEELPDVGPLPKPTKRARTAWVKKACDALEGAEVHRRVLAMCRHAAFWEAASGEASLARSFATLARELEDGPLQKSKLMKAILEDSLPVDDPDDPDEDELLSLFLGPPKAQNDLPFS